MLFLMPVMAESCNLPATQLFWRQDPSLSTLKSKRMNYFCMGKSLTE